VSLIHLHSSRKVYSFGCGRGGRLGREGEDDCYIPIEASLVDQSAKVIAIAAGGCHSLVLVRAELRLRHCA
jgi:alpha-tubulin suppressor-like RCC1 family protein